MSLDSATAVSEGAMARVITGEDDLQVGPTRQTSFYFCFAFLR
jgi:hypothetical protein